MTANHCFKDSELKAFVEQRLTPGKEKLFALHLFDCGDCQGTVRALYEKQLTDESNFQLADEESARLSILIKRLTAQTRLEKAQRQLEWDLLSNIVNCDAAALLAADDQSADEKMRQVLRKKALSFVAMCERTDPKYWRATLRLPTEPAPDVQLRLKLEDANGALIKDAKLIFCGIERDLEEGCCFIEIQELQGNLRKQTIALCFSDGEEMSGWLELFPENLDEY